VEVAAVEWLLPIRIEPLEEGGYLATSEVLAGFLAQGRSITETLEIAHDVARKLIESYVEHGDPLPDELLGDVEQADDARGPSSSGRGTGPVSARA
jgi:predicted RNase H-like HicB family nuclease